MSTVDVRRLPTWARTPPIVLGVSFAAGAIPFSNLMAHRTAGVDLRHVGSGTVSGTSLYRVAGFVPLAVAGIAEVAKGAPGPLLAGPGRPGLRALACGAAVCGHNWSPFLRGAGGRGISPSIGALLATRWQGAALLLGGMVAGRVLGETAIGSLAADAALIPLLSALDGSPGAATAGAIVTPKIVKRLMGNAPAGGERRRTYLNRLILDRDTRRKPSP